jgi:hypothetical protein
MFMPVGINMYGTEANEAQQDASDADYKLDPGVKCSHLFLQKYVYYHR